MADTKYISYIEDDNNQYKFQLDHPQQVTMQDGNTLLSDIIDGKKDISVQLGHHNFLNGHNIAVCGYNNNTAYNNTFLFGRELEAAAENQTIEDEEKTDNEGSWTIQCTRKRYCFCYWKWFSK